MAGVALMIALTIGLLHGDTVPTGEVSRPRLGEILIPGSQVITFSGWVDFPAKSGDLTISVRTGPNIWMDIVRVHANRHSGRRGEPLQLELQRDEKPGVRQRIVS